MRSCLRHPSDCHNSRLRVGERTADAADAADRRMAAKELKEQKRDGDSGRLQKSSPKASAVTFSPPSPAPLAQSSQHSNVRTAALTFHFSFLISHSPLSENHLRPSVPSAVSSFSIFHCLPSAYSAPTTASPISRVPTRCVPSLQISPVRSPSSMTLRTAVSIASAAACSLNE